MKKKTLVLAGIVVCTILLTSPVLASASYSKIYGNANEDDVLDMRDVTYIKLVIFGKKPTTTFADANYDGKVSMLDIGQTKLIILDKEKKLTLVDHADRTVTVPRPIERIVAGSSDVTRIIIALGACDKLVGITYPGRLCMCYHGSGEVSEAKVCAAKVCGGRLAELPEIGKSMSVDNLEIVTSLKPDVIFDSSSSADATQEKTDIPTIVISSPGHDYETMCKAIEDMGIVLEKEKEADELISFVEEKIARLSTVTSQIPDSEKPKAYLASRGITGYAGEITRTTGCYYPIDIAGGINVAKGISGSTVLKEQIIAWDPDIILIVVGWDATPTDPDPIEAVLSDPDLQTVNAVKNENVYYSLYPYCYGTPQDRNLVNAFYLAKLFHPDKFDDLDVEEESNEIYERFLGVDDVFTELTEQSGINWMREWLDSQK
jgi:iron complex transport system substrate-binding protein